MEEKPSGAENAKAEVINEINIQSNADTLFKSAHPMCMRFVREISKAVHSKWHDGARMSAVVANLILQDFLMVLAAKSQNGEEFLNNFYDGAKRDAIGRLAGLKKG